MSRILVAVLCVLALRRCSKPEKPETERPPAPQAQAGQPDPETWDDASKREKPATRTQRTRSAGPRIGPGRSKTTTLDAADAATRGASMRRLGGNAQPTPEQ